MVEPGSVVAASSRAPPSGRRGSRLLVAAGALLGALLLAEFAVRAVYGNPVTDAVKGRGRGDWAAFGFRSDPELEYSFEPGVEGVMNLVGSYEGVPFRISAQGLRDEREYAPEHPGVRRVLLVGDSFVFGTGVELQDTLGRRLEAALASPDGWDRPTEVVAVGAPAYALDSYALLIERWLPRVRPDVVVLCLFPGNDLLDYGIKALDRKVVVGGALVSEHEAWSYRLRRASTLAHMLLGTFGGHRTIYVARPPRATPEQLAHMHETMLPWIERATAAVADGPPLVVAVLHGSTTVNDWHQGRRGANVPGCAEVLAEFRERGALVVDPRPAWLEAGPDVSRCFLPNDVHYTRAGADLVAGFVARALRQELAGLGPDDMP